MLCLYCAGTSVRGGVNALSWSAYGCIREPARGIVIGWVLYVNSAFRSGELNAVILHTEVSREDVVGLLQ